MRRPLVSKAVVFLWLSLPAACFAWGRDGHRIIADIASGYLTPQARAGVTALLPGQSMTDVADWADQIRSAPAYRWTAPLHYADVPPGEDHFVLVRDCPADGCVVSAVIRFDEILRCPDTPTAARSEALKFLIHFVADAHQPMHVARTVDRGGNDVKVEFLGQHTNLHKVWDFGLIEAAHKPWPDYAAELRKGITAAQVNEWTNTDPVVWANESYRLAMDHAYAIPQDQVLGQAYVDRNIAAVNDRLAMAGVRLAAMLNAIFAEDAEK